MQTLGVLYEYQGFLQRLVLQHQRHLSAIEGYFLLTLGAVAPEFWSRVEANVAKSIVCEDGSDGHRQMAISDCHSPGLVNATLE